MGRDRNFGGNRNRQSNYDQMYSEGSGSNSMYNDYGQMNNRGSRSNNRAQPLLDLRSGMSRMDDDEDFTADSYAPAKSYGSMGSMGMGSKTPEQIAFDNEFEKWEQSFADWKLNNRNHQNPDQYRMYEQKFLDVRTKLLKKRRELYGEGTNSGSGKNPFDSQLNAADAMANSILSKFGSAGGIGGRKNNNNNNNSNNQGGNDRRGGGGGGNNNRGSGNNFSGNDSNNGGRSNNSGRNNNSGGNSGRNNNNGGNSGRNNNNGGGGNNDILNNELILTALKVITGGMGGPMGGMGGPMGGMGGPMGRMGPMGNMRNNMGPMGNMGGPMGGPMFNRGGYGGGYGGGYNDGPYGSGYGRNNGRGYGDGYGRGNNNGPQRRPGGDSRLGPQRAGVNKNNPANKNDKKKKPKKPAGEKKELKEGEFDSSTPFLDRVPVLYEEARKTDLPKLLSGAGNRRYKILKDKEADKLSEKEKNFMEYATYVFKKREEYYIAHPKEAKEAKEAKTEDVAMTETKVEEKTADAKVEAKADAKVVEDVEMNEDELLKD